MNKKYSIYYLNFLMVIIVMGTGCDRYDVEPAAQKKVPETGDETLLWGELQVHQSGAKLVDATHVVVLMHGFGANAHDMIPFAGVIPALKTTCFVFPEAPIEMGNGRRAWWDNPKGYESARGKVIGLLNHVKEQNPNAEILLGGFSQGAMLSSNFLEKDSHLVSALILLSPSGQLREELTGEVVDKPQVFLAHGRGDKALPFDGSEALQKKLVEMKYQVDWVPFDGGHTISKKVLDGLIRFIARIQSPQNAERK